MKNTMQDIKPQEVFANLDFQAAPGNDVEAARQCVQHALNCAAQTFADQDGSKRERFSYGKLREA